MPLEIRKVALDAEHPAHAREHSLGVAGAATYQDGQRIRARLRDADDDRLGETTERAQVAAVWCVDAHQVRCQAARRSYDEAR